MRQGATVEGRTCGMERLQIGAEENHQCRPANACTSPPQRGACLILVLHASEEQKLVNDVEEMPLANWTVSPIPADNIVSFQCLASGCRIGKSLYSARRLSLALCHVHLGPRLEIRERLT